MKFLSFFGALSFAVSGVLAGVLSDALRGTMLPGMENVDGHDPTIMYNPDSKKYFVFVGHDGFRIWTSPKLTGPWVRNGSVIPASGPKIDVPAGVKDYWAPDIAKVRGQYVLSYTITEKANLNYYIGLSTSPTMEPGSWTDHGLIIKSLAKEPHGVYAIDANIWEADDGKVYLNYGSWIDGMFQHELDPTNGWARLTTGKGKHLAGGHNRAAEGGTLYKIPGGRWYYYFFSAGLTHQPGNTKPQKDPAKAYHVRVGRSKSPSGPFLDRNGKDLTANLTPAVGMRVLISHDNIYAPGGQSLYFDPVSNQTIIIYHYMPLNNLGVKSYLGISFVKLDGYGWPVIVRPPR